MADVEKSILDEALQAFDFGSAAENVQRCGEGHINDTFRVDTGAGNSFILQRMSAAAFRHPGQLMRNIIGITEYLAERIKAEGGDRSRETMEVLRPRSGQDYYTDSEGGAWRVFHFIKDSCCYLKAETPAIFESGARAFGKFQHMLGDYPAETLFETIPRFHDTEDRLAKLKEAIASDVMGRAAGVQAEIDFVMARQEDCSVVMQAWRDGLLPLRVTHNDTKLSNVLFDRRSGESLCVIDLDTTMPGLIVNDFGDGIRSGANRAAEDEKDPGKVNFDIDLFRVYTRGFLEGADGGLTKAELDYLPWGARLMTLECGMRFLTDYLEGDRYFHIRYPDQNLDRCRTQFKLVSDMEGQFEEMAAIVASLSK